MRPTRPALKRRKPLSPARGRSTAARISALESQAPVDPEISLDLLAKIHQEVDARMGALEQELQEHLVHYEGRMLSDAAEAVGQTIHERLELLENAAAVQLQELTTIEDSSQAAARRVDAAVTALEQMLVVPPVSEPKPVYLPKPAVAKPAAALTVAKSSFVCPRCSSPSVVRTRMDSFYARFLRLFFIQLMHCKNCSHRFLRF